MRPLTVSWIVDRPRGEVYDYLSDVANHAEFTDHFLKQFRLARLQSRGIGAGARYLIDFPLGRTWAESSVTELEPPHSIVMEGAAGRIGRIRTRTQFRLTDHGRGMTRVELTYSTEPATPADRLKEALGQRAWLRAKWRRALRRMAEVLEQGEPSSRAVRVAAG
jgi:uncharacterized protein YndB with AHSA1/START domain